MKGALKSLGALCLLALVLPLVALPTLLVWLVTIGRWSPPTGPTVLVTGGKMTKALQLARAFARAGYRVVLAETPKYRWSGHRFSRAVARFALLPVPEADPLTYAQALAELCQQEQVSWVVPVASPVASLYDAQAAAKLPCPMCHGDPETVAMLDDKFAFCERAQALGLSAPNVFRITDPQQVLDFDFTTATRPYILKRLRYDAVARLELRQLPCPDMAAYVNRLGISPENPWVLQEFIAGQEYCTHSTVRNGHIRLHVCCPSSPFQVNYQAVAKPKIREWIAQFVQLLNYTGQISLDIIETPEGEIYPIECNPRTHSAIATFYNHPDVAKAYFESDESSIEPLPDSKPVYWLMHELWRGVTGDRAAWGRILQGKEALWASDDPLPFFTVPYIQIGSLLLRSLLQGKDWVRIDFNIGKLVELGGD
ncbi:MAG: ATP-grasp enzyme [Pseudanabaenaceae cyanobacterium]